VTVDAQMFFKRVEHTTYFFQLLTHRAFADAFTYDGNWISP